MQKVNSTHKKERKQQKGEVNGNGRNAQIANGKRQRGKNNIKKVRKRLLCWQNKSTLVFGKAS